MHCPSCGFNIDNTLEDQKGIINSSTNYAASTAKITYDPHEITIDKIKEIINDLGYTII